MGNCQAIDAATLVIQHPNGKVERFYGAVSASEVMKMNPGHYVALLISTTLCPTSSSSSSSSSTTTTTNPKSKPNGLNDHKTTDDHVPKEKKKTTTTTTTTTTSTATTTNRSSVRITRIKLLRPTDTLVLGQVYRLITTQEVMKGLWAKKQAKGKRSNQFEPQTIEKFQREANRRSEASTCEQDKDNNNNVAMTKSERHHHRPRTSSTSSSGSSGSSSQAAATARPRTWQPSLLSISEAAS